MLSAHPEMLRDLQEFYGTEDLYDIHEVMVIDARNRRLAREWEEKR